MLECEITHRIVSERDGNDLFDRGKVSPLGVRTPVAPLDTPAPTQESCNLGERR